MTDVWGSVRLNRTLGHIGATPVRRELLKGYELSKSQAPSSLARIELPYTPRGCSIVKSQDLT